MPFPLVSSPARFADLSLSPLPVLGCLDILSPQFRLSGIALAWSMVLFTEPHQHRRRLRAGGLAWGVRVLPSPVPLMIPAPQVHGRAETAYPDTSKASA